MGNTAHNQPSTPSRKQFGRLFPAMKPRQRQDNWPGCPATIEPKHPRLARKKLWLARPNLNLFPQNPNRSRSLPCHDLKPPEPKQRSQLAGPRPQAPRTQTEVAGCQTSTSSPQNPNRGHSLPGPRAPRTHTMSAVCVITKNPVRDRSLPVHTYNLDPRDEVSE